jgi:hypothetical protein
MTAPAQNISSPPPRASHRARRWTVRIILAVAILFVLLVVAAQLILWTDLPRKLVINAVQKQLGLAVSAKSLSTGWLGHTTLYDVTLTLPLADKAFVTIPVLRLTHTALPLILMGHSASIQDISIEKPTLVVQQDAQGTWNLEEVAQLLVRTGGGNGAQGNSQQQDGNAIPSLPDLRVSDGTLLVLDNRKRSATISPFSLSGKADGPLVWRYDAQVPGHMQVEGKVAPGGPWSHEASISIHDLGQWASPWVSNWPQAAFVQAHWNGQMDGNQLSGWLTIDDAHFGNAIANGSATITASDGRATIQPQNFLLSQTGVAAMDLRLDSGQIVFSGPNIESRQLGIDIGGGRANLDGKFGIADGAASVNVAWRDVAFPAGVTQSGDLAMEYMPTLGQSIFHGTLNSKATLKSGSWDAQFALEGSGQSLRSLSVTLKASKLLVQANNQKAADLSGLVARVDGNDRGLALTELRVGNDDPIVGQGGYTFSNRVAWLTLEARDRPISAGLPRTLDLDFDAWVSPQRVHLRQLYARSSGLSLSADGEYQFHVPKPVTVHVYAADSSPPASQAGQQQWLGGVFRGRADLDGTLFPLDLNLLGSARGSGLRIKDRPVGDMHLVLRGGVRDGRVSIACDRAELLGGQWTLSGHWPIGNGLFRLDRVQVEKLPLTLASGNMAGSLDGNFWVEVQRFDPGGIAAGGSASITNLKVGKDFAADRIDIPNIKVDGGMITLDPIVLTRRQAGIQGNATLALTTTLEQPTLLSLQVAAADWPLPLRAGDTHAELWADGKFDLDARKLSATGHVDLRANASTDKGSIGQVQAAVDLNGRTIDATSIHASTLNGHAQGNITFDFDHPLNARASLDFNQMDLSPLSNTWPALRECSGRLSGSLRVAPATTPRPLEPLAVNLVVHTQDGRCYGVPVGDFQAFAFAGHDRFVLDDAPQRPTEIAVAGGDIGLWGRISKDPDGAFGLFVQLTPRDLKIDQLLPPDLKSNQTPGLLAGQITLVGPLQSLQSFFGEGHLDLTQSDLANTNVIAFIYNLMRVGHDFKKPVGRGTIDMRLHDDMIDVTAFRYFDRGNEVRSEGVIKDLRNMPYCPIDFPTVGLARPLASIHIPGFGDIDDALSAVQHFAWSARIVGTLRYPKVHKIAFGELGQEMRSLLVGDVRGDTGTSPD